MNCKIFVCAIISLLLIFISLIGFSVWIDKTSCKQRAEAYNLRYMYKFPAGCLIGVKGDNICSI